MATNYYTKDAEGAIAASADWLFDPDALETTQEIVRGYDGRLYFSGSEPEKPAPTLEELQGRFITAVQTRLDGFAQTRTYDSIISAASYATSKNDTYRTEGQYCVEARDETWQWANAYFNEVITGNKPIPTLEQFMAELDNAVPLVWPVKDIRASL